MSVAYAHSDFYFNLIYSSDPMLSGAVDTKNQAWTISFQKSEELDECSTSALLLERLMMR